MQIVERGHIKLDDDVKPFVPELARMQILRGFDAAGKPDLVTNDKPITLRCVRCLAALGCCSSVASGLGLKLKKASI